MTSRLGLHLSQRSSFSSIFRSQEITYSVSQNFLASPTFHVINPLNHRTKFDTVTVRLPVSTVMGLKDEEILALLTKGFFGGWVFALEGSVMRAFGGVYPASYTGLKDRPSKRIIWKASNIPEDKLIPIGDMLFDFALVSKHIQTSSDPSSSYVDYGFGSDKRSFSGSHRFVVNRKKGLLEQDVDEKVGLTKTEDYIELNLECLRCDPLVDRDAWVEYVPWLHYWYARFLWADAVKAVLQQ